MVSNVPNPFSISFAISYLLYLSSMPDGPGKVLELHGVLALAVLGPFRVESRPEGGDQVPPCPPPLPNQIARAVMATSTAPPMPSVVVTNTSQVISNT